MADRRTCGLAARTVRGGGRGYQNGGPLFANLSPRLSLFSDPLRTVLAVKGSLRRAQQRRALDRSGPFRTTLLRRGKGSLRTAPLAEDHFAAILVPFFAATDRSRSSARLIFPILQGPRLHGINPRRSPRMTHLCSDRVTHQKRRTLIRKPQVGKALSPPPKAGRWVRFREQTRVISRECRRTPELRHASALPDLPTYLTCPAFAVLCPPSVSCSRLIGPRSYPCLCPAPSTPAKRPKWPSEPALIARLLPIPFDAVAWHHPTTLDAESLRLRQRFRNVPEFARLIR